MNQGLLAYPRARRRFTGLLGLPLGLPDPVVYAETAVLSTVTGSGSTNTKSAWAELVASSPIAADGFWISLQTAGNVADYLFDFAFGSAGGERIIIDNLLIDGTGAIYTPCAIYVPLAVPIGERISARHQSTDASMNPYCVVTPVRGGIYSSLRCRKATTYGAATADSGGLSVDPGGSINVKGAWHELTAKTDEPIDYVLVGIGGQNNATRTSMNHFVDIGYGPSGGEKAVVEGILVRQDSASDFLFPPVHMRWPDRIPGGQRLVARQSSSNADATDRLIDIAVVGFTA